MAFKAEEQYLPSLHFALSPPIPTETPKVVNGQGGIDEESFDGVDETIDIRASMAAIVAGG